MTAGHSHPWAWITGGNSGAAPAQRHCHLSGYFPYFSRGEKIPFQLGLSNPGKLWWRDQLDFAGQMGILRFPKKIISDGKAAQVEEEPLAPALSPGKGGKQGISDCLS